MMALTMAFVGEAVPKPRTGSAMGLLGTMSARHRSRSFARRRSDRRLRLAGDLLRQRTPGRPGSCYSRGATYPPTARASKARSDQLRQCGNAAAGTDARGLCARDDDRARQVRPGQHGTARGRGTRCRPLRVGRCESSVTSDPIDEVPRSGAEREPGHERARLDGDDGDAGGRAVLSRSRTRPRHGSRRNRHVRRAADRRADRCARRTHRGPPRRATHDRHRARRDGGRLLALSGCRPRSASPAT